MEEKKIPLLVLTGPTAAGKTALSLGLAKVLHGEIISADSMQVYRKMDIGAAKLPKEEQQGIPHHLLDILEPEEEFHVAEFVSLARKAIREIDERGHLPIVVGGTGFYIQALLKDIDFSEGDKDSSFRAELEKRLDEEGPEALHRELAAVDPASAETIHFNNTRRVIRALEYYRETGKPISEANEEQKKLDSPYNFLYFVLTMPREILYERIEKRVDKMMEDGLLEEVRELWERGLRRGTTSMQGLGYKELLDYLEGECSLEEAVQKIKTETRHFAKRQLTWFRREESVLWIDKSLYPDEEAIRGEILKRCREAGVYAGNL